MMNKNKKAILGMGILTVVAVFVLGGFVAWWLFGMSQAVDTGALSVQRDGVGDRALGVLTLTEDTTVTFSAVDVYDSTIAIGGNHQYIVNEDAAKTDANLGTETMSPGDTVSVLFGQGNSTGTVVYLNSLENFIIPDRGTKTLNAKLYRNGTITTRIFNEEGDLITAVVNETLTAGDLVTLDYSLQGQYQRGQFAHGGCAVVEYNATAFDNVIIDLPGNRKIGNPSFFTVTDIANIAKTYTIPPFVSSTKLSGALILDVDDVVDPVASDAGTNPIIHYYPNEYRLNSNTNQFELFICGENEDGDRVSNPIDTQEFIVRVS